MTAEQRRDLLEIVEDRYGRASTLLTSQLPVSRWHDVVGEPTLADTILDRIVHHAQRIELKGARRRVSALKGTRRRAHGPLYGLRGRAATRLTKPQQPATPATAAASCRCRPDSSESVAPFDRTRWPASTGFSARLHWNGHYDTDARDRTRKVGQTRSLIVSSSDANVCVLHDKV